MHFYVDESGNTGTRLFDANQPTLYYGVLSSRVNIDVLAQRSVEDMCRVCGVDRLHATDLGNLKLSKLASRIVDLQQNYDLRFDVYRIVKPDHAVTAFFDQVFDHGVNPAITWSGYWTPLRYMLLLKLAYLFDEKLAETAWEARIDSRDSRSQQSLVEVCKELRMRAREVPDERSRQLISDTLEWAERNPGKIHYNGGGHEGRKWIGPNIIGFQSVMLGIASRLLKLKVKASQIIVDQQAEFNRAQKSLADFYARASNVPMKSGPGLPEISFRGVPDVPIEFGSSATSAGLQLTDIYLWAVKRVFEEKDLAPELFPLVERVFRRGQTNEISLNAIAKRWAPYFTRHMEMSGEQISRAREILELDESRRLHAIAEDRKK